MRALVLFITVLTGCTRYEYQEDLYLEIDGSGEIRVSCSQDIFTLLYGTPGHLDEQGLAEYWESPDLQLAAQTGPPGSSTPIEPDEPRTR